MAPKIMDCGPYRWFATWLIDDYEYFKASEQEKFGLFVVGMLVPYPMPMPFPVQQALRVIPSLVDEDGFWGMARSLEQAGWIEIAGAVIRITEKDGRRWIKIPLRNNGTPGTEARTPISPQVRAKILKRDRFRCRHCGSREELQIDHIKPWAFGGGEHPSNLQVLCRTCNTAKGPKPHASVRDKRGRYYRGKD